MAKEPDVCWRAVGFREVFDLLDLDRYDAILLESFRLQRTNEKKEEDVIEVFQRRSNGRHPNAPVLKGDNLPVPITNDREQAGKSLGKMTVGSAKRKFL